MAVEGAVDVGAPGPRARAAAGVCLAGMRPSPAVEEGRLLRNTQTGVASPD